MIEIPRETNEYLQPTMTVDGQDVGDFLVAIVAYGQRPTTWTPKPGPKISGMASGYYEVYGKVTRDGQDYVRHLGDVVLT